MKEEKDLLITCVDCGKDFVLTDGERNFYNSKGLFLPRRCPACRKIKKEKRLREEASRNA